MQNQHLKSYKDEFSSIAEGSIKLCRKYEGSIPEIKSVANQIEKNVKDRFHDFTPRIMVYGIYNAGKSTILNALIGEEKAAMADVPTTKIVQEYHWKEYTIYDTPGIGAPEEEEERVSKEQLQKCDVILFVTDTEGGFSLGKNYQELIDIIKSGKRLLIVLNNKSGSGFMSDTEAVEQIKGDIYLQFAEAYGKATPEELSKSVSIILVNARNAFDARTKYTGKGREVMLEKSNIAELEEAIIQEYGKANGFTILKELSIQLNSCLEKLMSLLENSIEAGKQSENKGIQELQFLRDLQDKLIQKVTEQIQDDASNLDTDVFNIMLKSIEEGDADKDEINEGIQTEVKQWAEQIHDFLNNELKNASLRYKDLLGVFDESITVVSEDIGSVDLPKIATSIDEAISTPGEIVASALQRTNPKDIGEIVSKAYGNGKLAETGITSILAAASELPWIGEAAGSISTTINPYIAPVVIAISVFIQLFGDDDEETDEDLRHEQIRAENEAERRRAIQKERMMREIKEKSRRLSRKISTTAISNVSGVITDWFAPRINLLDTAIAGSNKENETILNDIRIAEQLKTQLNEQIATYCNQ